MVQTLLKPQAKALSSPCSRTVYSSCSLWLINHTGQINLLSCCSHRHVLLNSKLPSTSCVGGFKYAVCSTGSITAPLHGRIWCRLLKKKKKKDISFGSLEASKPHLSLLSLISSTAAGVVFTWAFTSFVFGCWDKDTNPFLPQEAADHN